MLRCPHFRELDFTVSFVDRFAPSTTCGPFRGNDRIHSIISVEDLPCIAQQIFDFIASIGFVIPFLVLLL